MHEPIKLYPSANQFLDGLEDNEGLISKIRGIEKLSQFAELRPVVENALEIRCAFTDFDEDWADSVVSRLDLLDNLILAYSSSLKSAKKAMNKRFRKVCNRFSHDNETECRKELDEIVVEYNLSRESIGDGGISANIRRYSDFKRMIIGINEVIDTVIVSYSYGEFDDPRSLKDFSEKNYGEISLAYRTAVGGHKHIPVITKNSYVRDDATKRRIEEFKDMVDLHHSNFSEVSKTRRDVIKAMGHSQEGIDYLSEEGVCITNLDYIKGVLSFDESPVDFSESETKCILLSSTAQLSICSKKPSSSDISMNTQSSMKHPDSLSLNAEFMLLWQSITPLGLPHPWPL